MRNLERVLPVFIFEQNLAGISTVMVVVYVFRRRLGGIQTTRHIMLKHGVIHKTGSV